MKQRDLSLAAYLTAAVMELSWLSFGVGVLRAHIGLDAASFALILAVYLLALSRKLVADARLTTVTLVGAMASVTLVLALAALAMFNSGYPAGGVFFQIIFSGAAWWLGNSLIREEIEFRYICYRFQIGLLSLLGFNIFAGGPLITVVLFFVTAAFALALARWEDSLSHSTAALQAFRLWLNAVGALAVLLPAAVIFIVFSPDAARAIVSWLAALGNSLANVLSAVPAPSTNQTSSFNWSCAMKPGENTVPPTSTPTPGPPVDVSPIVFWLVILAIFLVVLWIIFITARTISRRRNKPAVVTKIEISSIRLGLLGWLTGIGRALRRFLLSLFGRWQRRTPLEDTGSVRALYRAFLQWAEKGLSRPPSQTPLEYEAALSQKFPEKTSELKIITGAYVRARYSRNKGNKADLEAARVAWNKVRSP